MRGTKVQALVFASVRLEGRVVSTMHLGDFVVFHCVRFASLYYQERIC